MGNLKLMAFLSAEILGLVSHIWGEKMTQHGSPSCKPLNLEGHHPHHCTNGQTCVFPWAGHDAQNAVPFCILTSLRTSFARKGRLFQVLRPVI